MRGCGVGCGVWVVRVWGSGWWGWRWVVPWRGGGCVGGLWWGGLGVGGGVGGVGFCLGVVVVGGGGGGGGGCVCGVVGAQAGAPHIGRPCFPGAFCLPLAVITLQPRPLGAKEMVQSADNTCCSRHEFSPLAYRDTVLRFPPYSPRRPRFHPCVTPVPFTSRPCSLLSHFPIHVFTLLAPRRHFLFFSIILFEEEVSQFEERLLNGVSHRLPPLPLPAFLSASIRTGPEVRAWATFPHRSFTKDVVLVSSLLAFFHPFFPVFFSVLVHRRANLPTTNRCNGSSLSNLPRTGLNRDASYISFPPLFFFLEIYAVVTLGSYRLLSKC